MASEEMGSWWRRDLGRRVLGVRAQIERSDVGSCVMRRRRVAPPPRPGAGRDREGRGKEDPGWAGIVRSWAVEEVLGWAFFEFYSSMTFLGSMQFGPVTRVRLTV